VDAAAELDVSAAAQAGTLAAEAVYASAADGLSEPERVALVLPAHSDGPAVCEPALTGR
jgi:hypothetical protein